MTLKIVDSNFQISKNIYSALAEVLNRNLKKNSNKVRSKIKSLIPNWIQEQPEIASLLDINDPKSLNGQFKFIEGEANRAVNAIIMAITNSVEIEFEKIKNNLDGGIVFYIQPDTFTNLLTLSEATISRTSIPWLDWLLNQGTKTIVYDLRYSSDDSGRSGGGAISFGKTARVPPQFAGTSNDNFVTRAFENREKQLIPILQEAIYG